MRSLPFYPANRRGKIKDINSEIGVAWYLWFHDCAHKGTRKKGAPWLKILKLRPIRVMRVNAGWRGSHYNRWSLREGELMSRRRDTSKRRERVARRCAIVKSNLHRNYPFPRASRMVFRVVYRMYPHRWGIIRRCGNRHERNLETMLGFDDARIRWFPAEAAGLLLHF